MMPIVDMLVQHAKKEKISMHMPGHKAGMLFSYSHPFLTEEYSSFLRNLAEVAKHDVTETLGVDSLHDPKGAILKAMELTASTYGAASSFFLVNGSTCGVHAMIYSSFRRGDTVFVSSDCHMSVFNALMVTGCNVVVVPVKVDEDTLIPLAITPEDVRKAYEMFPDSKGIVMTRPNYYGVCADLAAISEIIHENKGVVLVDEAHGGHFGFNKKIPESALSQGCDMCVQSAHKTLQSLNQGAFLHIADNKYKDKVFRALKVIETTSPSFLILATLDFTREYMKNMGRERLDELADSLNDFVSRLEKYEDYIISDGCGFEKDITRLVVCVKGKGVHFARMLADRGVYCEMYNDNCVVFILTCADDKDVIERLFDTLVSVYDELSKVEVEEKSIRVYKGEIREINLPNFETYMNLEYETVDVKEAVGRISSQFVIPYPPGIPVIFPYDRINDAHADICRSYCIERINVIK